MSVWLATLTAINRRKSAVSFCVDPEGATGANVCMAGCPFWYQSGKTLTQVCPIFNPPANFWQKTWCSLMSTLQTQQPAWLQTNLTTTNNQLTTYGSSTCVSQHPKLRLDDFLAVTATSAFRKKRLQLSPSMYHYTVSTPTKWRHSHSTQYVRTYARTHAHTHTFNGLFSTITRMSQYQKGKTNLDFTEARDNEWQWHQLGHMQVWTSLQTGNHASTPPLSFFTRRMPFLPPNNSIKALKAVT